MSFQGIAKFLEFQYKYLKNFIKASVSFIFLAPVMKAGNADWLSCRISLKAKNDHDKRLKVCTVIDMDRECSTCRKFASRQWPRSQPPWWRPHALGHIRSIKQDVTSPGFVPHALWRAVAQRVAPKKGSSPVLRTRTRGSPIVFSAEIWNKFSLLTAIKHCYVLSSFLV